jgi:serine/threonine protein kinase
MPAPTIGSLVDEGNLELVSIIGQGGFASVYLARSTTCSKVYALKVLHNPPALGTTNNDLDSDGEQTTPPHHLREARLHSLCTSRLKSDSSITPLLKTIIHPTTTSLYTCLLLPYYPSGDLFTAILTHKLYLANPSLIKSTFLQILNGVDEAHSMGVFLRDLKPENCLLDGNGRVFLCDFGLATDEQLSEEFRTGSVYHMSPGEVTVGKFFICH